MAEWVGHSTINWKVSGSKPGVGRKRLVEESDENYVEGIGESQEEIGGGERKVEDKSKIIFN